MDEIQLTHKLPNCLINPLAFEDSNIQEGAKTKVECQEHDSNGKEEDETVFKMIDTSIKNDMQEFIEFSKSNNKDATEGLDAEHFEAEEMKMTYCQAIKTNLQPRKNKADCKNVADDNGERIGNELCHDLEGK